MKDKQDRYTKKHYEHKSDSYEETNLLSDGRTLSVLVHDFQDSQSVFVGTDADGINWGKVCHGSLFPSIWHVIDTQSTPAILNNHVRFMVLGKGDVDDPVLYAATYEGVSYATYQEKSGFGSWKTATRLEFLGKHLTLAKDRVRSIHIAYDKPHTLDQAKFYIATDRGLWVTDLDISGTPSTWKNTGLGVASISSVYATGNNNRDLVLAGTTVDGLAVGIINNENIIWQAYSTKEGLPCDDIWDVYLTGKQIGDVILVGTNGGGMCWAVIEELLEDKITLSAWKTVNDSTPGFANNCNAQLYATGNQKGDVVYVATRDGLSWAHFDSNKNLNDWKSAHIPDTTNDIGSVLVKNNRLYLGIYRTGIAATKLDSKGNPTTWTVVKAKKD